MNKTYYFAYGSNLDRKDLQDFCTREGYRTDVLKRVIGVGTLERFKLVFGRSSIGRKGGVLDVWESPDDHVPGVVFEVNDEDLKVLDHKEGHPNSYRRTVVTVLVRGAYQDVITYVGRPEQRRLTVPHADYVAVVRHGYQVYQVRMDALERAILEVEAIHD